MWVLLAPMQFYISSDQGKIGLHWKSIGEAGLRLMPDDIVLSVRVFFWQKNWYPLTWSSTKSSKKEKPQKKKQKKKWKKIPFRKVNRVLHSLKIKECIVDLDTDNYMINSLLYPVFYFLSHQNRQLTINYRGQFYLSVIVETTGFKLLKAIVF